VVVEEQNRYWFAARSFGWGWGLALTWQGWVTYGLYAATMVCLRLLIPPAANRRAYLVGVAAATFALVLVCWLKGEPPRWRWGRG
jgi:hypothetical protein